MRRTALTPKVTLAIVAVAALLCAMTSISAQQPAAANSAKPAKAAKGAVQEITLPQYPADLPPGPHLESFQSHCLLCHSARYVTGQPHFPRAVWEKEVKKMVDVYGAPITPAEQPEIVDYLVAIRGPVASQ
jgi:cytochrome c5